MRKRREKFYTKKRRYYVRISKKVPEQGGKKADFLYK